HYMLRYAYQGNFLSPVDEALKSQGAMVLDVGCGSGIWALEMGTDYPHATIHALDLAPVFPTSIKPTNVHFQIHDATTPLPFPDGTFDLVKMRFLVVGLKKEQWPAVVAELARVTKPGGYVELCEPQWHAVDDVPAMAKLHGFLTTLIQAKGADIHVASHLDTYLASTPLLATPATVKSHTAGFKLDPTDSRRDRLASLARQDLVAGLKGFKPVLVGMGSVSSEEYDVLVEEVEEGLKRSEKTWSTVVAFAKRV
ncbi:hypothetical protein HK104_001375, partial [Borealophlyctis nickersoniae]